MTIRLAHIFLFAATLFLVVACSKPEHDVIIRGGTVYDGTGGPAITTDLAIDGDRISQIGNLEDHVGRTEINANGLAVAPGFINMLSWANESLIQDSRSMSDIYQGVTLEVMGEGTSMGPLNEAMRKERVERQKDIKYKLLYILFKKFNPLFIHSMPCLTSGVLMLIRVCNK